MSNDHRLSSGCTVLQGSKFKNSSVRRDYFHREQQFRLRTSELSRLSGPMPTHSVRQPPEACQRTRPSFVDAGGSNCTPSCSRHRLASLAARPDDHVMDGGEVRAVEDGRPHDALAARGEVWSELLDMGTRGRRRRNRKRQRGGEMAEKISG